MRPRSATIVDVALGLDVLLADPFGDGLLVGHGLRAQTYPLDGLGSLGDVDPLLAEDDLVLLLGDGRPTGRIAELPSVIGSRSRTARSF